MKLLFFLLLLSGYAFGQMPTKPISPDSLIEEYIGEVSSPAPMPIVRADISFQRYSANLMRASTDNMPIKLPNSSTEYTMQQLHPKSVQPDKRSHQFLKPMPRTVPKRFRH